MTLHSQSVAAQSAHRLVSDNQPSNELKSPYLIYFGDVQNVGYAKTGLGLIEWRPELCAGQMRLPNCQVDVALPEMTVEAAVRAGVRSLVIGVASAGGSIPVEWVDDLAQAARAGLDIVSGMHTRLAAFPKIIEAAQVSGARLIDVRTPPKNLAVATGVKRSGKRILTVGTDCAVGKKYTALAIEKELRARGADVDFRATGQTGIMIAGSGIVIDSVISDFLAGAAEMLSPCADQDHWDVIEGQGALSHPTYAGVSLGLLHGSQPDALVLCHDPSRAHLLGLESCGQYPVQSLTDAMHECLILARRVNPNAKFSGVAVNTSGISSSDRTRLIETYTDETGLPVADPIKDGVSAIVDNIQAEHG